RQEVAEPVRGGASLLDLRDEPRYRDDRRRGLRREAAQRRDEVEAVHVRQQEVLEDELWLPKRGSFNGLRRRLRLGDGVAFALEGEPDHLPERGAVLHDQHERRSVPPVP